MDCLLLAWDFICHHVVHCGGGFCCAILTSVLVLYGTYWAVCKYSLRQHYATKRKERRKEANERLANIEKLVQEAKNNSITELSLLELTKELRNGKLKAVDVLKAYWSKALEAHARTNCLVEPIAEAIEAAEAFDSGNKQGLLAGIPVSIKDDIGIKNYNTTAGAAMFIGKKSADDSALVKILRKHGAVIFVRTNIPQLEASGESSNPIYGTVKNPHNISRNPGGSSSGEGALIASGASLLGFGSDIGGSIRIPSHLCGICGFKPTSQRVSHLGMPAFVEDQQAVSTTWGPLARDVDSLILAMKALWDGSMAEFDPLSPPLPFQNELLEDKKPLKIGYFYDNTIFTPTPAVKRAMDMAIAELRRQGHTVIAWTPPNIAYGTELWFKVMSPYGQSIARILDGDVVDSSLNPAKVTMYPRCVKQLLAAIAPMLVSKWEARVANALVEPKNALEYWRLDDKIRAYQNEVTAGWKRAGLDAVLCPPMSLPATPLNSPDLVIAAQTYMLLANVLNFPSGVVRMTKQTKNDIEALRDYEIRNKLHMEAKECMKNGEGLPVGVLVTSLRWQDEKCLRIMKCVENAADFSVIQ